MFSFASGDAVVVSGRPEQLDGDEGGEGQRNGCAEGKGEAGGFAVGEAAVDAFECLLSAIAEQAEEKEQGRRHGRQPKEFVPNNFICHQFAFLLRVLLRFSLNFGLNGARIDSFWSNGKKSNGKKKKSTFFGAVRRVLRVFLFCLLRLVGREGFCRFGLLFFIRFLWIVCYCLRVGFYLQWVVCDWFLRFGLASSSLVGGRAWIG